MGARHVISGLATLALLVACKRGSMRDPHAGQHELTFHNEIGVAVCALYIYPEHVTEQGNNWFPEGHEMAAGESMSFWVEPGVYQVRAAGCTHEPLLASGYAPRVRMNMDGVVVLFREDVAASRQAASRLAHENENTTRVLAKLIANKSPTPKPVPKQPPEPAGPGL